MITSQFLRDLFELITLNHIAYLIFAKISQLNSAFQTRADFFYVVLETPECRNSAIVNRLTPPENASPCCARDPTIGYEATSDDASA